jgi:hypothetical protein
MKPRNNDRFYWCRTEASGRSAITLSRYDENRTCCSTQHGVAYVGKHEPFQESTLWGGQDHEIRRYDPDAVWQHLSGNTFNRFYANATLAEAIGRRAFPPRPRVVITTRSIGVENACWRIATAAGPGGCATLMVVDLVAQDPAVVVR